jgi:hypothetical protein
LGELTGTVSLVGKVLPSRIKELQSFIETKVCTH